jgi:hypothetical protein
MDDRGRNLRLIARPPRRLLGRGIVGLRPAGSAESSIVAALGNEFGAPPYAVVRKRQTVRRIARFGFDAWPDGFSRDGRLVLAEDRKGPEPGRSSWVEVVPFAGGRARVIARSAGEASWNA